MTLRPTNKLALHESQRPDEASSKIKVLSIRSSIPARTHTTTNNATEPRLATTFGDISRAAKPQSGAQASRNKDSLQQAAAASKRGHRRGFSFVPGDDSADPVLSKETPNRNNGFQERTTTPLASVEGDAKTSDRSHESLRTGSNSTLAVGSRPYQYLPEAFRSVSDLGESPKLSEHYGSGKSVLTAFKGSSSGSPSLSYRGSMSSIVDSGAVKENGKQRGNSHYAIAAARAAKNVSLDVKATQRQSAK